MKKVVVILVVLAFVGATIFVFRTQQGAPQPAGAGSAATDTSGQGSTSAGDASVTELRSKSFGYEQLLQVIGSLNEEQRNAVLADEQLFNQVVGQEALRLSYIDAANASQFANNERIQYLLERQADDFLVKSYVTDRLGAAGVPEGFPSEQQILQYYEQNKQRFMLAERVPVWQVFWKVADDASKPAIAKLLKKATLVANDIKKGKISFEQAALTYSQHAPSRLQGGYMGMLKTADLRPEIKESLLSLKEGVLSKPIRGETGLHIFKRGPVQPAEMLPLSQVRERVIQELVAALRRQQRTQLDQLVQTQYPVGLDADLLGTWQQQAARHFGRAEAANTK